MKALKEMMARRGKGVLQGGNPERISKKLGSHPDRIAALHRNSVSLFISNLPNETSIAELESMFWHAGKIVDAYIPVDRKTGEKRGITFVRFKTTQEALNAIDMVQG